MLLFGEMIFKITNYIPYFRVETCSFTSPFLYLSVPPSAQNVTVISTSIIDKRTQVCQLTFIEDKLSTNLSLIYDNGYSGSNETLFANHPGSGLIGLAKYGIGNNIVYSIVKTDTYADYTANINKQVDAVCIMSTGQPLGFNEQINMASSIGQIVVLQYWISRNVEYFQCQASNDNMACKSLALLNKKDEILIMSHEETN